MATYVSTRIESNNPNKVLKFKGLNPIKFYSFNGQNKYGGDKLMEAGINLPYLLKENEAYEYYLKSFE